MDNKTIGEMKRFMKTHNAYCSFNCIPMESTVLGFELANGVFKKLFIDDHSNPHHRGQQLVATNTFLQEKALNDFNEIISDSEGDYPEFIISILDGIDKNVYGHDISVETVTASNIDEAKAIIESRFSPRTVFMVKHYLTSYAREVYDSLMEKNYGVNLTKRKDFDGHRFQATVNTHPLRQVPALFVKDVLDIFERSFSSCKIKRVERSLRKGFDGIEYIRINFDRVSELNRLKLYDITKNLDLNVNVSIDALTGENSV